MRRDAPSRDDIESIALTDPCLAHALVVYGRVRQVFFADITIASGGMGGDPPVARMTNPTQANFYVFDFTAAVYTPNANAGSQLAGQQQLNNAKMPNIDAKVLITAGMSGLLSYDVNSAAGPMDQLARHPDSPGPSPLVSWTSGWLIPWGAQVQITHILKRVYLDSELPIRVVWALHASFVGGAMAGGNIEPYEALKDLDRRGYRVPKDCPGAISILGRPPGPTWRNRDFDPFPVVRLGVAAVLPRRQGLSALRGLDRSRGPSVFWHRFFALARRLRRGVDSRAHHAHPDAPRAADVQALRLPRGRRPAGTGLGRDAVS